MTEKVIEKVLEKPSPAGPKGSVVIDAERCKGCGLCAAACGRGVLGMSERVNAKGYSVAEVKKPERCTGCMLCALMCPDVAIKVYRRKQVKSRD